MSCQRPSWGVWLPANTGLAISSKNVEALAIDPITPSTIHAGTLGGVFKSIDGAGSWFPANPGLPAFPHKVVAFAIDPITPSTIYAGTITGGVFKSTDRGANWSPANAGLNSAGVFSALAIDPSTPSTLYAGTLISGIFKSSDSGDSWSPANWSAANTGLPVTYVKVFAIDPSTPSTVYAGTFGGGVFDIEQVSSGMVATTSTTTTTVPCTSARCTLESGLASPACAGQTVPPSVAKRFSQAASLIDQAASRPTTKGRKLLKRAKKALKQAGVKATRAAKGKKPKISPDCARALRDAAEGVVSGLGV